MRNFTIASIAILLLLNTRSMAQAPAKVTGNVTDQTHKSLATATVSLLQAKDSNLVKAAISDASGKFEISIAKAGNYLLGYSLVGFENKYSTVFSINAGQAIEITTMALSPAVSKLQAVTVTSKKPMIEVKADKTIFNVEASINATGSNALELLQKSPGIQVDNNENISMKGKTGVRIYIDGKMMQLDTKDLAAYLKSINSNDIEAIEMISNPSAKYDASGNA
ncbi:MAG: carboxypeptidase regulatory-like domain-containing protein, partial [Ferruginibacter sp.]